MMIVKFRINFKQPLVFSISPVPLHLWQGNETIPFPLQFGQGNDDAGLNVPVPLQLPQRLPFLVIPFPLQYLQTIFGTEIFFLPLHFSHFGLNIPVPLHWRHLGIVFVGDLFDHHRRFSRRFLIYNTKSNHHL